jgi:hypothetical protein
LRPLRQRGQSGRDEIIRATSEAFLGLTLGCARCHDHKFDPLSQKDYYAFYGTFAGVQHAVRPVATKRKAADTPAAASIFAGKFDEIAGRRFHVFTGGDPQKPSEDAPIASLVVLDDRGAGYRLPEIAKESERRLALARWIVAPENPLTPRVLANRLWQYHFGAGIVDTPSDFGYMGGRPTHPEKSTTGSSSRCTG